MTTFLDVPLLCLAGMHPGGPAGAVGSAPMSQEATAVAAANAAAAAAAAVLQRGGAQASPETMEQVPFRFAWGYTFTSHAACDA